MKRKNIDLFVDRINEIADRPCKIMEVCGTHTEVIARSGIKTLLSKNIQLVSGPGCPVCVTDESDLDTLFDVLTNNKKEMIIVTFGDMMRIKGSNASLYDYRKLGYDIRVVYTPFDCLKIADRNPYKKIVFLAVGFETTAPIIALLVKQIKGFNYHNVLIYSVLKTMPAILKYLFGKTHEIQGIICPGHVAAITGSNYFSFLTKELSLPSVITGFEPKDLLIAIYSLLIMNKMNKVELLNRYQHVVQEQGNRVALQVISSVFEEREAYWRGIGVVPNSGYTLKPRYEAFDAKKVFDLPDLPIETEQQNSECCCAQIIMGQKEPRDCPLFRVSCQPKQPLGACMVSREGACAIAYRYND